MLNYPERWIGRNGPLAQQPRSPDLTPLDFLYFKWKPNETIGSPVSLSNVVLKKDILVVLLINYLLFLLIVITILQVGTYCKIQIFLLSNKIFSCTINIIVQLNTFRIQ